MYDLNQPGEVPPPVHPAAEFGAKLAAITPDLFVTKILVAMNVVLFLAMIVSGVNPLSPSIDNLIHWGADFGPKTVTAGEWWRMGTSTFLHIGVLHIAFNMFVLWQVGPFVERLLGNVGFAIVYAVSGLAGAFVSLAWNPYVVSAGASGAIFGLYGALLGFLLKGRDAVPQEVLSPIVKNALFFIGYNIIFGFVRAGTDVAAHAGGLAAGFLCGLVLSVPLEVEAAAQRNMRNVAVVLVAIPLFVGAAMKLPRPVDVQAQIKTFGEVERRTLAAYNRTVRQAQMEHMPDEQFAERLEKDVLPDWVAEREKFGRIKGVSGPAARVVSVLVTYMDERTEAWRMLIQALRKHDLEGVKRAMVKQREAELSVQQVNSGGK